MVDKDAELSAVGGMLKRALERHTSVTTQVRSTHYYYQLTTYCLLRTTVYALLLADCDSLLCTICVRYANYHYNSYSLLRTADCLLCYCLLFVTTQVSPTHYCLRLTAHSLLLATAEVLHATTVLLPTACCLLLPTAYMCTCHLLLTTIYLILTTPTTYGVLLIIPVAVNT